MEGKPVKNRGGARMNKLFISLAVLALVGLLVWPVVGSSHDWGRGRHMMGFWGDSYGRGYGDLTSEQRDQMRDLDQKYYDKTVELRRRLWDKSDELDSVLNSPNPDDEKVKALHKEISQMRSELEEQRLDYELKARKIAPDHRPYHFWGGRDGYHRGEAYGRGMGYGRGPGYCW